MPTVSKDIALNVIANIREYQRKIGEIPGVTEKAAGRAALQLERRMSKAAAAAAKSAQQAARETAKAAQKAASANERVGDIIEQVARERMTASERAVVGLQKELAALERLEAAGADLAQVERARVALQTAGAQRIAAARARELGVTQRTASATRTASTATMAATKITGKYGQAVQSVAVQLPDVIQQMHAGVPAATIAMQQGLQVVQVNMGLVLSAGKRVAALFSGPMLLALAAFGTAAVVVANHLDEQRDKLRAFEAAVKSSARALDVNAINGYARAHREMAKVVEDSNLVLLQEQGLLSSLEVTQFRAIQTVQEKARAVTLEAAAIWARLQVQRQELLARLESGELDFAEQKAAEARIRRLDKELPKAKAALDTIKDDVEARQLQVFETYEQIAAIQAQRDAETDANRAAAAAKRDSASASEDLAAAEKRREAQVMALIEAGKRANALVDRDIALRKQQAAIIDEVTRVELVGMQKIAVESQKRIDEVNRIRVERLQNARGDQFLIQQAEVEHQEAMRVLNEDYQTQRTEFEREQVAERARLIEEENQLRRATAANFAQFALSTAASSAQAVSQILADKGQKKRARQAFRAAKALNVALLTMETIRAARASLLPPPVGFGPGPLGRAAQTVTFAGGATQLAVIKNQKPPKFYRGTERVGMGSRDEVPAVLHKGEAVLNRRAAESTGRENIRESNATGAPLGMGARVVPVPVLKHRMYRDFYRDDRSMPGSLTRRDRRTGGTRVGRQL